MIAHLPPDFSTARPAFVARAGQRDLGPLPRNAPLRIGILFRYRDEAGVRQLVQLQSDRRSPLYKHYLTKAQWNATFAPSRAKPSPSAWPRPCPDPVISTFLPVSCRSMAASLDSSEGAVAGRGDDAAEAQAREVGADHQVGRVGDLVGQRVADGAGRDRVEVEHCLPVAFGQLDEGQPYVAMEWLEGEDMLSMFA